ncbi:WecB/TagA/CpsF family glycosyltransferase [Frankia sp. BMG5.11]|uniref:WecB/TagA/CpsF family glycosyltransferase n=1 Tax=Parafrankia sp. BMG5.11 TaxID=222540 RepID=UPI00103E5508|nr:glycosyltransferase [Parafrankia sp. BMG5.11]
MAGSSSFSYVVTPNVDHLVQLHRRRSDAELWLSYRSADVCLCDSRILQTLAKSSGIELQLVPGSDLTASLLKQAPERQQTVAVVGGDAEMFASLEGLFPDRTWHHHIPPMGVRSNPAAQEGIIEFVEATAADATFFAIGAPQSELLCHRIGERGRARGVALCIGASLEFLTGEKKRAPVWMQRLKLEWLFRLLAEPRRLGRRYLVEGPNIFRIWYHWRQRSRYSDVYGSSRLGER